MNRWASLFLLGLLFIGCGGDDDGGGGSNAASCKGTIEGEISGAFNCTAVANYFPDGKGLTEERKNTLVTVLNNEYDATHTRPAGIKVLGTNIELVGEPKAGSYSKESTTLPATLAYVNFQDGRYCNVIKAMTLELTEATFDRLSTSLDITSRVYNIHGSVDYTVTDTAGGLQVRVKASF